MMFTHYIISFNGSVDQFKRFADRLVWCTQFNMYNYERNLEAKTVEFDTDSLTLFVENDLKKLGVNV